MGKLKQFLKAPYPFYFEGRSLLFIILVLFSLALLFEFLFEPFEVYTPEHKLNHFWITVIHSGVAIICLLICSALLQLLPRPIAHWTVAKEVVFLACFLLITGIGQFLVRDLIYDNPQNWSWNYLFEEIRNTFLIGMLLIAILVPINQRILQQRNQRKAGRIHPFVQGEGNLSVIPIKTMVKGDDFNLYSNDFIYAEADRNYVSIQLRNGVTHLKRISISSLERQLQTESQIMRTHRSYLVNTDFIEKVTGNAQGYQLQLQGAGQTIPVSRHKIPLFESRMKVKG
ncbi:LytTR family DNA-binding domain-containing protein [Zeaxanthinibacter sp. PT1]|uniref:LytR/AlgR family response regulator transcription factor n=1 Tax=Zeaxanthinibacter TaxID=561554 RepID=UPI00234AC9B7|nr:LytTR family DNA-binding domain-containing protein [Zeaxanthinibacter sp. PT1]MDC6350831.1 LytTR family DNA-binding domain-containing protein [Zeaxanthinibacter sp. PT1]